MEIRQSCVVAPLWRSRWMVRGNPSDTVMLSAARLTMPSSNAPRAVAPASTCSKYHREAKTSRNEDFK